MTSKYLLIRIHRSGSAQSFYTSGLLSSIQCLVKGIKKKKKKKKEYTVYMEKDFSGIAAAMILQHGEAMHHSPLLNHPTCRRIFRWHWLHQCCMEGMDVQSSLWRGCITIPTAYIHQLVIILMMLLGEFYKIVSSFHILLPVFFLVEFYMPSSRTDTDVFVTN